MNILGIGIDIVKISKFKNKPYSKNQRFYKKLFLMSEIKYCLKFKDNAIHFAGKFAIKESVKKSIRQDVSFLDIETYYLNSKPKICLIHGNDDEVVPKRMMETTKIVLEENNIENNTHIIQNLGHSINQEGLNIGENFLVKHLLKC